MPRVSIKETITETSNSLDTLIPEYAVNKSSMDRFKRLCDDGNKEIKRIMNETSCSKYEVDGWVAKLTIQKRESVNEDKMLEILQANKDKIPAGIIKVKPYIDSDVLENAIYKELIPNDLLIKLAECNEVKEVEILRVVKAKKKEDE